jgi:RNA polymerase sigma factor (sigma-70 family)
VNDQTNSQLLRAYAEKRSEAAFSELVRRHLDLVYSAALRMVCDRHLAEDVTQGVFLAFAKSAGQLADRPVISGWLHRTAQNIAAQTVRTIERRRAREQEAVAMTEMFAAEPDASWDHIAPHLDAALGELDEADRDAVMLRYFERKSALEMAQIFGVSDAAAQKRVSRAVERLREFFAKRGVRVGASALAVVVSANAIQAAPVGLAISISTAAALSETAAATTVAFTATKAIVMTTLQKTLITATMVALTGAGIYESSKVSQLQTQVAALQQQQAPLTAQIQQLEGERDETRRQLASLRDENERLIGNTAELLRLRSEVGRLRRGQETAGRPSNSTGAPPAAATANRERTGAGPGQELGLAVVRGDPGAFDRLVEVSRAAHTGFATNRVGLSSTNLAELQARTFAPGAEAFDVIGEAAVNGNQVAIAAVERALQVNELKGYAARVLGMLAGKGNEGALEMLINPDKYGILLSSSVSALGPPAEVGNQKAIDALAAVTRDEKNQALWFLVANGLAPAAESGNPVAVDGLIAMTVSTNLSVRNEVVSALKKASAKGNAKARETLRSMGVQ